MRIAVAASALLHLALIVVTMIAWPGFSSAPSSRLPPSIPVELVTVAQETNIRPERKATPEPPREEPKPEPPKPEPPKPERVTPPPAPERQPVKPEPEPEPEPEPLPEPEKKPEAKPEEKKPEPKPEEKKPPPPPKPRPRQAEKKPPKEEDVYDQFAALLDKRPREEQQERVFHEDAEATLAGQSDREGVGLKTDMTVSMLDNLRLQMSRCWNVDAGALNADELVIEMVIEFNPDGTLRPGINNPRIKNQLRYATDSYFRAAADAAVMAVRECEGDGYELRDTPEVHVTFDPSKMVGGR